VSKVGQPGSDGYATRRCDPPRCLGRLWRTGRSGCPGVGAVLPSIWASRRRTPVLQVVDRSYTTGVRPRSGHGPISGSPEKGPWARWGGANTSPRRTAPLVRQSTPYVAVAAGYAPRPEWTIRSRSRPVATASDKSGNRHSFSAVAWTPTGFLARRSPPPGSSIPSLPLHQGR